MKLYKVIIKYHKYEDDKMKSYDFDIEEVGETESEAISQATVDLCRIDKENYIYIDEVNCNEVKE